MFGSPQGCLPRVEAIGGGQIVGKSQQSVIENRAILRNTLTQGSFAVFA